MCNRRSITVLVIIIGIFPSRLQTGLDYIFKAIVLKNNEAIESMFRECIDKATGEIIIVTSSTTLQLSSQQHSARSHKVCFFILIFDVHVFQRNFVSWLRTIIGFLVPLVLSRQWWRQRGLGQKRYASTMNYIYVHVCSWNVSTYSVWWHCERAQSLILIMLNYVCAMCTCMHVYVCVHIIYWLPGLNWDTLDRVHVSHAPQLLL